MSGPDRAWFSPVTVTCMSYLPVTPVQQAPGRPRGVTGAAIGLIVAGAVSFVCGAIWMAAGLSVLSDEARSSQTAATSDIFAYVVVLSPVITVFLAPATIIGGIQLLRRANRGLATVGAIAAVVPLSSCCFLVGVPFGIWALVVLRRPETRAWYAGDSPATDPYERHMSPPDWY